MHLYYSSKRKIKMDYQTGHVMTLANSIIGVSVLAMPYCFKQCGIVLSILMLLISSIISRLACHFLMKSAIIARRKTFEFLAFYIFGAMGKFAIEIGIIGFLIGTCIAFFVVMGDLAPEIISEITGSYSSNTMRTSILMALALFCVLPLGLLRNVDSLNGVSKATIGFYCCLVLKIVFEAIPHIFSGDWFHNVNFWRPAGILQCLPIFTMALFCQTQLFEIYQALQNATLEKMNNLVKVAVNICTCVYIFVGVFGYIAFFQKPFTGNVLLSFSPSLMTDVMKIGFILSVAFSFPLVIFPCRASLYSLLYKEGYPIHEGMSTYIPEGRFKGLTLFIVFISLIIGIMIPNIELVLGLVGSTIGVMICVLFPVTCFICISPKNTNERILAQLMLMIGIFVMVLGTYKNLYSLDNLEPNTVTISSFKNMEQLNLNVGKLMDKIEIEKNKADDKLPTTEKVLNIDNNLKIIGKITTMRNVENEEIREIRHEPPQPIEPIEETEVKNIPKKEEAPKKNDNALPLERDKVEEKISPDVSLKLSDLAEKPLNESKNDEVDIEAIKKEDKEVEQQAKEKIDEETNQVLIDTIQKQNEVQKEFVEQQKKINEEKVKAMKEIESIARQAIEKISGGNNDDKIVADVHKQIKENLEINEKSDKNEGTDIKKTKNNDSVIDKHIKANKTEKRVNSEIKNVLTENRKSENDVNDKEKIEPLVVGPDSLFDDNKPQNIILKEKMDVNKYSDQNVVTEKKFVLEKANDVNVKQNKEKTAELVVLSDNKQDQNNLMKTNDSQLKNTNVKDNFQQSQQESLNVIKQTNTSQSNTNNININNTAPLFLKLGKSDVKANQNNVNQMVPLPIIVSGKINNQTESNNAAALSVDSKEELQLMRKDIL